MRRFLVFIIIFFCCFATGCLGTTKSGIKLQPSLVNVSPDELNAIKLAASEVVGVKDSLGQLREVTAKIAEDVSLAVTANANAVAALKSEIQTTSVGRDMSIQNDSKLFELQKDMYERLLKLNQFQQIFIVSILGVIIGFLIVFLFYVGKQKNDLFKKYMYFKEQKLLDTKSEEDLKKLKRSQAEYMVTDGFKKNSKNIKVGK